jgi:penicillin-binding protein 1A
MNGYIRIALQLLTLGAAAAVVAIAVVTGGFWYVEPSLPDAEQLRDVRYQIPLSVYSRDGRLMAQFGEQRRTPAAYEEVPELLIEAILAAEDDKFFEHSGIDYGGTARAIFNYVTQPGQRNPGGSTITQQITRVTNLLSRDRSLVRKFKEWILAFRIESEFTKEEILELYLNTYFFGQRSYGVVAAARTYFDKELDELTLSEVAIIAGIPTGPSEMNPYNSPENARARRAYVLRRLLELGKIDDRQRAEALAEPIVSHRFGQQTELKADYVAEMVRAEMIRRLGPAAYTEGLKVTTTIDSRLQSAANGALRTTLINYDETHGYRGPSGRIDLETQEVVDAEGIVDTGRIAEVMSDFGDVLDLRSALVVSVDEESATVYMNDGGFVPVTLDALSWARPYITESQTGATPGTVADVLSVGDVVRFRVLEDGTLRLAQLPVVQGAFVSVDPQDGAIVALVGGFDYFLNNYNRATQALRQPGSSFKPFMYSAALENGYTLASIINDAPLVEESPELEKLWKPENFTPVFHGETPLREALKRSMNLAAIRTLRDIGVRNAIQHLRKFGFDDRATPANSSLALGAGGVAPVDLAKSYAVFANGGYRVSPYFIQRIEDANGEVLYDSSRSVNVVCRPDGTEVTAACEEPEIDVDEPPQLITDKALLYPDIRRAPRVVSAQNIYLISDVLRDVVRSGSGARAYRELRRLDIAGKTGTTNGPRDAWFAGFNPDVVAVAWVGFDDDRPMSSREQGGVTAIPMWIEYMAEALGGQPERTLARPTGIVDLRINPQSGLVASDENPNAVWEKFRVGHEPEREADSPYLRIVSEEPGTETTEADAPIF